MLEGNFYGPNHEEAGGTFAFHFRPPTTIAEDRDAQRVITMGIIGVFGAKKQP